VIHRSSHRRANRQNRFWTIPGVALSAALFFALFFALFQPKKSAENDKINLIKIFILLFLALKLNYNAKYQHFNQITSEKILLKFI
jgi:hypothetical protein